MGNRMCCTSLPIACNGSLGCELHLRPQNLKPVHKTSRTRAHKLRGQPAADDGLVDALSLLSPESDAGRRAPSAFDSLLSTNLLDRRDEIDAPESNAEATTLRDKALEGRSDDCDRALGGRDACDAALEGRKKGTCD